MRKLCVTDFNKINGISEHWYGLSSNSCKEFKQASLYAWIFNVTKMEVFDVLGWEQHYIEGSHQNYSAFFPVFDSEEKALLFLITAITLHNETETRI